MLPTGKTQDVVVLWKRCARYIKHVLGPTGIEGQIETALKQVYCFRAEISPSGSRRTGSR